jgi:hypothetical protein
MGVKATLAGVTLTAGDITQAETLGIYEEIVAKGIATPRQIDAALDRHADAVAKGRKSVARTRACIWWILTHY